LVSQSLLQDQIVARNTSSEHLSDRSAFDHNLQRRCHIRTETVATSRNRTAYQVHILQWQLFSWLENDSLSNPSIVHSNDPVPAYRCRIHCIEWDDIQQLYIDVLQETGLGIAAISSLILLRAYLRSLSARLNASILSLSDPPVMIIRSTPAFRARSIIDPKSST
jgi:hypothetical protein